MRSGKRRVTNYKISDSVDLKKLFEESGLNISVDQSRSSAKTIYDTFDWRLYKKNLFIIKEKNEYFLLNLNSGREFTKLSADKKDSFSFFWDFPESELKSELASNLGIRALIPVAELIEHITPCRILNKDEKVVSRISLLTVRIYGKNSESSKYLTLTPVRGYTDEYGKANKIFRDAGFQQTGKDLYTELLKSFGIKPGGYSSKFRIKIDPNTSSDSALRTILRHLIEIIKINEDGIKKDIDIEFLHDFRVAVRRARSALSQIKSVLPEDITRKLKHDFSRLGKMTNRLRDLDVCLLKKQEYTKMLPEELQRGLEPIFKKLSDERRREHKKLKSELSKQQYKDIIKDAENCLTEKTVYDGKPANADTEIHLLAKKTILKKYKKIISVGSSINNQSPDNELHALRIECKKLRYLLEFFYSLYPPDKMDKIISQLKSLQDNLGDFNDLYVQQQSLIEMLSTYDKKNSDITPVSVSVGGLITALSNNQKAVRQSFNKTFSEFNKNNNRRLYKQLFTST